MISDRRLAAVRRRLAEEPAEAFVITDVSNVRYLSGFESVFDDEANVALLVTSEVARVYTDFRYSEAAQVAAEGSPWVVKVPAESLYVEMAEELVAEGIAELMLESSVPYGRFRFISEKFAGKVTVVDQWVETLRQVKEDAEIERIAAAAALTDRAFEHILGKVSPGVTEAAIALELEVFMRENGSEGVAFAPIVASGPNSSRPHATVTDRELAAGDFVTLDFGARVQGYCADMTRTVVLGRATERQRETYALVLEANEAAHSIAKAGLRGSDIDAAARSVFARKGLDERFGHGLGHGVGLDVHELPSLSPRGRDAIPAGAVVTIEPGVYIPEFGGVRIENLVVIETGGCKVLDQTPKQLIELPA